MKIRHLFASIAISFLPITAFAEEAATTPAVADDLSQFKTADDLWKHFDAQMENSPKSQEDAILYFAMGQRITADFIKRFPNDPRKWQAKLMQAQFSLIAAQLSGSMEIAQELASLEEISAAPDAPAEIKQGARLMLLSLAVKDTPAELEKAVAAYEKDFPNNPIPDQLKLAFAEKIQASNPSKSEQILNEVAKSENVGAAQQAQFALKTKEMLGKPVAIKFTALDGKEVDLAKMHGQVVLVNFWATWCAPCIQEMPNVVAAYKKLHDKGFEIVGISLDDDKEAVLETIKKLGMTWPQYFDSKGWQNEISTSFGITSIPQMWLIDKKGNLVSRNAGGDLEAQVEKLLAE